ncbi:MAG: hypothetical protein AAFV77_03735 [Planctomycetota bacterium]
MRRRPRVISVRAVVASLLFAVVVAVGSVPLLAWRFTRSPHWVPGLGFAEYSMTQGPNAGAMIWHFRDVGYSQWNFVTSSRLPSVTNQGIEVRTDPRPRWALPPGGDGPPIFIAHSAGFPFLSARGWRFGSCGMSHLIGPVWLLDRPCRELQIDGHFLGMSVAIVPRWPGLIANTLFFFSVAFVPWTLVRWRRLARIERLGLCYKCRYEFPRDIKTCPECGTTRPRRREDS